MEVAGPWMVHQLDIPYNTLCSLTLDIIPSASDIHNEYWFGIKLNVFRARIFTIHPYSNDTGEVIENKRKKKHKGNSPVCIYLAYDAEKKLRRPPFAHQSNIVRNLIKFIIWKWSYGNQIIFSSSPACIQYRDGNVGAPSMEQKKLFKSAEWEILMLQSVSQIQDQFLEQLRY